MDGLDPGVSMLSEDSNPGITGRPIETDLERLLEDSVEMETHVAPTSPEPVPPVATATLSLSPVVPDVRSDGPQGAEKPSQASESWALMGLSGRLEDLCRDLRRSVEHEFALSERQLQAQHLAELEAQRLKAETLSHQQQVKIENLEAEVKLLMKALESKQKQFKSAVTFTGHVRQNLLGRLAFENGFHSWQARAAESKSNQLQDLLAKKLYAVHTSSNVFGAWRHVSQTSSREKLLAHERASAGAVRAKLFEQMELERTQLVAQVEDLKKSLGEEAQQRQMLQDNLKRVFMRGVCALNFEAMSLLNDPQGGTATMSAPLASATDVLAAQTEPPGPVPSATAPAPSASPAPAAVTVQDTKAPPEATGTTGEGAESMDDTMQPQVSPTPLPFVSYTGPSVRAFPRTGPGPTSTSLPKSQRWQSASPARIEKTVAAR